MDSTAATPAGMLASFGLQPNHKEQVLPIAADPPKQKLQPKPQPKPKAKTAKSKPLKVAPLPAIVKVRGYEIMIPNTKTCWRVNVVHSCGHQVMEVSEVRYPSCDRALIVEINRHMRPCTEKCKVEAISHAVKGLCGNCGQLKDNEEEQTSGVGHGNVDGPGIVWNGLPQL